MVTGRRQATAASGSETLRREGGFTLLGLMVVIAVVNIGLGVAATSWVVIGKRAKEAELLWRGGQYVRALQCHREQTGGMPAQLDDLLQSDCIRALYPEPIDPDRGWRLIREADLGARPGAAGTTGATAGATAAGAAPRNRSGGNVAVPRAGQALGRTNAVTEERSEVIDQVRSAQERLDALLGRLRQGTAAAPVGNGIIGVASFSTEASLRLYEGEGTYDAWWFLAQ